MRVLGIVDCMWLRTGMANETKRDGASHVLFSNVVRFIGVLVLACHGGCLSFCLLLVLCLGRVPVASGDVRDLT